MFGDLWYFPRITLYVKALLGPLIFHKDPEESIRNFDELHPSFKEAMLTKGIFNLFPDKIKLALLPEHLS